MNIHESEAGSRGGPTEAVVSLTVGGQCPQSCCWGGGCGSLCLFSPLTEEAAAAGRDDSDSEQVSPWLMTLSCAMVDLINAHPQIGDDPSDLSEGEADSNQSDAGSEVSMDTAEQRELT